MCVLQQQRRIPSSILGSRDDLSYKLQSIDGAGYGAYKDIWGGWDFGNFVLFMDHIQGDAYAAPSRCRVQVSYSTCRENDLRFHASSRLQDNKDGHT